MDGGRMPERRRVTTDRPHVGARQVPHLRFFRRHTGTKYSPATTTNVTMPSSTTIAIRTRSVLSAQARPLGIPAAKDANRHLRPTEMFWRRILRRSVGIITLI